MDKRNLNCAYLKVWRDGKWDNVCFSDLSEEEMVKVMKNKDISWVKSLCIILGKQLKEIKGEFGIIAE